MSVNGEVKPRIIEREMPLAAISFQSAREKSIRHGHLSTLHIWWARRPLAACRAAIFAALVPEPDDPLAAKKMQHFIAQLSNWDNSTDNTINVGKGIAHTYIQDAREAIRAAFPDRPPRILDPFTGGGAIPLEALRLGCETHALDLNPVAHIIQLATLVYPQKHANRPGPYGDKPGATLAGDVRKWGMWVLDRARDEIGDLYPQDSDKGTVIAYLWAHTVQCPNPSCGSAVPLIRQTWLVRNARKNIAYRIETDGPGSEVRFRVVMAEPSTGFDFDPSVGTIRGGTAVCPCCATPLSEKYTKSEAMSGRLGDLPVAVITGIAGIQGKKYRGAQPEDRAAFAEAEKRVAELLTDYDPYSGELVPIPDEMLPPQGTLGFRIRAYGRQTWGDLFNARQNLSLATLARSVREAYDEVVSETGDEDYAKAVATMLTCVLDRFADYNSTFCIWINTLEAIAHTFSRQALPMMWDYVESNPFSGGTGSWESAIDWVRKCVSTSAITANVPVTVSRGDAGHLPYEDGYFDAVITDPPYYDSVPYADLSDFFYVWMRRAIGDLYPAVLGSPLTPKDQEIIQDPQKQKTKEDFERMLGNAFAECARVLSDSGICVVVYAHKAISAWESLVASLLRAGLTVDGSWPFSTERPTRLRAQNSAALASSIFLVCRKRKTDVGVGIAGDVRAAIAVNVRERLDAFWVAGLRGADFFISAIGPATAAFSRYDKVMTLGGAEITVSTLLEWVQETVADYALQRVFTVATAEQAADDSDAGLGTVDDQTRFYVLWRWTYDGVAGSAINNDATLATAIGPDNGEDEADASDEGLEKAASGKVKKIPFGDAHLMATALGADINDLLHRSYLLEGSNDVRLLDARERAEKIADFGERRADGSRPPLIDILHRAELLWATNQRASLTEYLEELSPGDREALRRVAQALVDLLPRGDVEKQRLEGFLSSGVAQGDGTTSGGTHAQPSVQLGLGGEIGQQDVVRRPHGKGRR